MAKSVAECLREILLKYITRSDSATEEGYVRLVLAGPPTRMLRDLFTLLTRDNQSPWRPSPLISLPVFLVSRLPRLNGSGPSCECNWDYALTIRNTFPNFILLVDASDWDERTYSIVNATDTVGTPLSAVRLAVPRLVNWNPLYAEVVRVVAQETGLLYKDLEAALRECLRDLPGLEPFQQQSLPWEIIEWLVGLPTAGVPVTANEVSAKCGLLSSTSNADYKQRRKVLKQLSDFLDENGIQGGIDELKSTARGSELGGTSR